MPAHPELGGGAATVRACSVADLPKGARMLAMLASGCTSGGALTRKRVADDGLPSAERHVSTTLAVIKATSTPLTDSCLSNARDTKKFRPGKRERQSLLRPSSFDSNAASLEPLSPKGNEISTYKGRGRNMWKRARHELRDTSVPPSPMSPASVSPERSSQSPMRRSRKFYGHGPFGSGIGSYEGTEKRTAIEHTGSDDKQGEEQTGRRLSDEQMKGHLYEIFVGNLPQKEDSLRLVRKAFESRLAELPEYRERYPDLRSPVVAVRMPQAADGIYAFVTFVDLTLATTAVALTGLVVGSRSAKVSWPSDKAPPCPVPPLDVAPLRAALKLPWSTEPKATMVRQVYVGGLAPAGKPSIATEVALSCIKESIQKVPEFEARFPEDSLPELVLDFNRSESDTYGFVTLANEVLASTLVAIGTADIDGTYLRFGWPDFATTKGKIPCVAPGLSLAPKASSTPPTVTALGQPLFALPPPPPPAPVRRHKEPSANIWVGNLPFDCTETQLDQFLTEAALALPTYDISEGPPIVDIRMCKQKKSRFCFVELRSKELAAMLLPIYDRARFPGSPRYGLKARYATKPDPCGAGSRARDTLTKCYENLDLEDL